MVTYKTSVCFLADQSTGKKVKIRISQCWRLVELGGLVRNEHFQACSVCLCHLSAASASGKLKLSGVMQQRSSATYQIDSKN